MMVLAERQFVTFLRLKSRHLDFSWHYHPEYELIIPIAGSCEAIVGDYVGDFMPGQAFFVGPDLPHVFYSSRQKTAGTRRTVYEFYLLRYSCHHLEWLSEEFDELTPWTTLLHDARFGLLFRGKAHANLLERLRRMEDRKETSSVPAHIELFSELAAAREGQLLASPGYVPAPPNEISDRRINLICRFLQRNYTRDLSIPEVAHVANTSEPNLYAFFKTHMSRSIMQYVTELRIGHACRLLRESQEPIAHIALDAGFPTLSNFNKLFRRLKKTTPRRYRNDNIDRSMP